jgi:hypothetical protein
MSMQEPFSELLRVGRLEGAERRRLYHLRNSGDEGNSIKEELLQRTERNSTSDTGSRTVSKKGTITVEFEEEDDEVMIEMEKGPRERLPSQTLAATKYRSRWMRRKPASTMATQTSFTWEEPEILAVKMEAMNLEAIAKKREKELKAEILSGTLRQERLKKQLEECTDDWQAELLHDVDEDTFGKLDTMAADLNEMATRERWLFCRSCKAWHMVPCSKTSSKFLMLSILGLLLQTRKADQRGGYGGGHAGKG